MIGAGWAMTVNGEGWVPHGLVEVLDLFTPPPYKAPLAVGPVDGLPTRLRSPDKRARLAAHP